MTLKSKDSLAGELLSDEFELSFVEFCRLCQLPGDEIIALVEEGIAEPVSQGEHHWRFQISSVRRVRCAIQLQRDLGVNRAGAALALELLDEIESLRHQLQGIGQGS
ncbi:MAG TPA: MerR family transcriptional regulator [Gammaproteobacteria bacterium]|nr:MerR family transcriptional regulator [Gammaproteobacteria bacterium]